MTQEIMTAPDRAVLEGWLDFHRATLERKCEGLDAEQMRRRSVPPSNLTLLGLVRHLTEVESYWFQRVLLDEHPPVPYSTREDPDGDFNDIAEQDPVEALAAWHAEVLRAREAADSVADLDALAKRERNGNKVSLRWILVHMIEEYARHNGHADLLREAIDGQTDS